jgi:SAM-dependent methyltransferase
VPQLADDDRSAAYYDRLAPSYDAEVTRQPSDLLARSALIDLVVRHVAPGSTVLDFGCGTGIDAERYDRHGYTVLAYDNSSGMVAQLRHRCADAISSGRILLRHADYRSFPEILRAWPAPNAVVANFAVLNMVRDPAPLLDAFRRHMAPPGWLFISVMNPIHWRRLMSRGWWQAILRRQGATPPLYLTDHFNCYLHFVPALLRAAPGFRLIGRGNAGTFVRYDAVDRKGAGRLWWESGRSASLSAKRALWRTPAVELLGTFVFLVLRRDA